MISRCHTKRFLCMTAAVALVAWSAGQVAADDLVEDKRDMALVGHDDLQARSAYQPLPHQQGGRFIAYVGHHSGAAFNPLTGVVEQNGVSIVDVTDPEEPVYLHHLPPTQGDPRQVPVTGAQMVQACNFGG